MFVEPSPLGEGSTHKTTSLIKLKNNMTDEQKIEVPAKFKNLVEEVEKMSIVELAELVKVLEGKFGVSAAAPVAAGAAAGPAEEKTSFYVEFK